mmetsp:Transcript_64983/g.211789  ORF Transcript_64983/g.211789 Transcript_64983/m.211789 type:complete len:232 (+) Transcript_64983:434-1129(+)
MVSAGLRDSRRVPTMAGATHQRRRRHAKLAKVALPYVAIHHHEQQGHRDADGIGKLRQGTPAETFPTTDVAINLQMYGGTALDLGGVLAGEDIAVAGAPGSACTDSDLAAGEPGIALRAAIDEHARRVGVPKHAVAEECTGRGAVLPRDIRHSLLDLFLLDEFVRILHQWSGGARAGVAETIARLAPYGLERLRMPRGDGNDVNLLRLHGGIGALQVLDGHLRLVTWARPP